MAGEGVEVIRIPPGVGRVPVLVVVDTGLPDGHEVDHIATVGRPHIDDDVRIVVQGGMIVAVLVDAALREDVKKMSLASRTLSYGR